MCNILTMNCFTKILIAVIAVVMLFSFLGCAKTDYMSWKHEDWVKANEKDRIKCAKEYTLIVRGEASMRSAKANVVLIDAGLAANPGLSVKDLADMAKGIGGTA